MKKRRTVRRKNKKQEIYCLFSGVYQYLCPARRLKKLYEEAISHPDIVVLTIATRPDCLSEEVVQLLREMNDRKPVWVELGLQTIHEKAAEYIRRGYPLPVYDEAVKRLKKAEIQVIVHVILGLP